MTINEKQDQIVEDFELFGEDWDEKYKYIIDLGKDLPPIKEQFKTDDNLIKGCQSRVWLHADYTDGRLCFEADSDSSITKGLVSMVIQVLSCQTPREIAEADIYFVNKIGLTSHLSPTRSNGLLSMLKQMKMYSVAYLSKALQ